MKLLAARHLWGVTEAWETAIPKFAGKGYGAIEAPTPAGADLDRLLGLIKDSGLKYIPMGFTGPWDREVSVAEHIASFRTQVEAVAKFASAAGVPHMTVHSGRDRFTLKEAVEFFTAAAKIEADNGIVIAHETHRGRVMYNPWRTAEVLQEVPATKLACDYSHWVVVCERLPGDCPEVFELAAERCVHVHTRVGYPQGPQVPDPSAPEYATCVEVHLGWWRQIWASQKKRGVQLSTFTPEFGPPEYLHTLPHTNVPVADLEKVCDWMKARVEAAFG